MGTDKARGHAQMYEQRFKGMHKNENVPESVHKCVSIHQRAWMGCVSMYQRVCMGV